VVHFYIGDGKGKTTAALGLALRARGSGKKVLVAQFLKGGGFPCSEAVPLKRAGVVFRRFKDQVHPLFCREKGSAAATKKSIAGGLRQITGYLSGKEYDLIVLDEILNAVAARLVPAARVNDLLKRAGDTELVLTGRCAPDSLKRRADYISLVKKIRHPFDKGISARKGIEF